MKFRESIFSFVFLALLCNAALADAWTDCGKKLIEDKAFAEYVRKITDSNKENPAAVLQAKANDIRAFLATKMFSLQTGVCKNEIVDIAKMETLTLSFDLAETEYQFDIDVGNLFDDFPTQTMIMVYNNRTKRPFVEGSNVIKSSEIKDKYWSDACSKHWISSSLNAGSSAVSRASKQIFTEFSNDSRAFFLDFADGDNKRAFPGIIIADVSWRTTENIVVFTHLPTAVKKVAAFADALKSSSCENQNLAVYLVYPDNTIKPANDKINFGRVGRAMMIPSELANIEQVYVLDGPYVIR